MRGDAVYGVVETAFATSTNVSRDTLRLRGAAVFRHAADGGTPHEPWYRRGGSVKGKKKRGQTTFKKKGQATFAA
jgi:hypothetical protein